MNKPTENAIKFTDEIYAMQKDVASALHIFNIDYFWKEILAYRDQYKVELPIGKIKGKKYYLTLTDGIIAKIHKFEKETTDFITFARNIRLDGQKGVREVLFTPILKKAAILEKSSINDLSISMLLKSLYQENVANHTPVVNYLSALDEYLNKTPDTPSEDFLGNALQMLIDGELMEFYRQNDFDNRVKMLQYRTNPEYPYAPYDMVEDCVYNLMEWLKVNENVDKIPTFAKAVIATLYLDYIKPFSQRNSLLAALLGKETLANSNRYQESFLLPFEDLLTEAFYTSQPYKESKNSCDFTYVIFSAMEIFQTYMRDMRNKLNELRTSTFKQEFSSLSDEEKSRASSLEESREQKPIEPTQLSLLETEEEPVNEEPIPEPIKTNPLEKEEIEETPIVPKEEETFKPVQEKAKPIEKETPVKPNIQIIQTLQPEGGSSQIENEGLSKAEIKAYIQYLLETNITLNKKQAIFLANHNTPGRYYTIQQYKKFASCVYETARTSMDKLASEGYYEKLQFKNKFVYTPTKKGK